MKYILGISAFYHDSAAAIIAGGEIIAAAQEERFTREKHTPSFPVHAIKYCLEEVGLSIDELDAVVFYDKPILKFERLLSTYYAFAPRGLISFLKAIPVWLNEKLFLKKKIYDGLEEVGSYSKKNLQLLFSTHHLSHAASAFYPSSFEESAILTIDGVGEWSTATIGIGNKDGITFLRELEFPHSVGLLYSAFTYYLGFKVNSGEYKLMGLAPYGQADADKTKEFISKIKKEIVDIKDDGSIWLNQKYFDYATGLRMAKDKMWEKLFGFPRRMEEDEITQLHCNLAIAIQIVTEEIVIKLAKQAKRLTGSNNLCMAGGVALNCVANGKLVKEKIFDNIYIQPAAGDAGGALGAALAISHLYYKKPRNPSESSDSMKGSYLGPWFSDKEIDIMNRKTKAVYTKFQDYDLLTDLVAKQLSQGKVVGWFQGRMEFGPRALGNRSILGDPTNKEMQRILNLKIKNREGFRPFAPSVLEEDMSEYFDMSCPSPYMLLVAPLKASRRIQLPSNYSSLTSWDKLQAERSDIQAVTHLDYSARIQTVSPQNNARYYSLIKKFKAITQESLLINTSFNVRGEPIVCTPYDAYRCFMSTEMDYLVIGDFVYSKVDQNDSRNKDKWLVNFKAD